jgi:four helix bundle protein
VDEVAEALKQRTKVFAIKVLDYVDSMPRTIAAETLARQLVRAGTGVAGNYRAACRSRSHAEFTARTGVVLEESDEAELWLNLSDEKNWGAAELRRWLLDESRQLRAIFSAAYLTARNKERQRCQR